MSQLGKICSACGRERSKTKSILFDPKTLQPYCESPYICNTEHPNSIPNLLDRGAELKLIPLSEAQKLFKEHLIKTVGDPTKIARIRSMVDKLMTIRIGDPGLATFILELQSAYKLSSVSDAIRYCIQTMKDNQGQFYSDLKVIEEKKEEEQKEQEAISFVADLEPEPEPEPIKESVPSSDDNSDVDEIDFEL
jgi:hypothetical protein